MRMWLVAMALSGCLAMPGARTRAQHQRRIMEDDLMPAVLDYEPTWKQPIREVTVRVWADEKYRAENSRWEKAFELQLAQVNAVLGAKLGIKLVVVQSNAWARHEPGSTLDEDLEALESQDDGTGAFVVIGLVSGQSLVSATFEELGVAYVGGHHVVVRGYADLEERTQFKNAFPDVAGDEIEQVLLARKQHKLTTVLLHELGHSLGVNHDAEQDTMMSSGYSRMVAGYSTSAVAAMLQAIDQRMHPGLAGAPPVAHHGQLEFVIVFDGRVMHDGSYLDDAALQQLLQQAHHDDPDTEVVVKKHKRAKQIALSDLVEKLRAAGLEHVSVFSY